MPGVVCTPHLGASTEEAQTQVAIEGIQLLINFFKTGEIRHAVNVAALDPKTLESLRGYLDVAHRLGRLMAQMHEGTIEGCRILYRGEVCDRDTKLLTAAFCAGLLENAMADEVNIINAELLLRERGSNWSRTATVNPAPLVRQCRSKSRGATSAFAPEQRSSGIICHD